MSTLLLDVGNSRLKWALAHAGRIRARGVQEHRGDPAATLHSVGDELVEAVWIANVTGETLGRVLAQAVERRYGIRPSFARSEASRLGLVSAYAQPQRLGVDRWLCLLALWQEKHTAFVVVSAGTALTFDAVDAQGRHLGGVIAPGLRTAQEAVLGATRFAAAGPDLHYEAGLGTGTEACVRQGALHACSGLIERLARRYAGAGVARLITGGDAALLAPQLAGRWVQRPELVLDGLLALAQAPA